MNGKKKSARRFWQSVVASEVRKRELRKRIAQGSEAVEERVLLTAGPLTNTAPVLSPTSGGTLTAIPQNVADVDNSGTSISEILTNLTNSGGGITDADPGAAQGLAITLVDQSHGTWQFTTDGGGTWTNFSSPSASAARLLASADGTRMRFVPNNGFTGSATFIYVAWDQTAGSNGGTGVATNRGGTKAYSLAYGTGSVSVTNAAPVLGTAGNPTLTSIPQNVSDAGNAGTSIAQLITNLTNTGGSLTDVNVGAVQGIAITSADQSHGTWQFTLDGGSTWNDLGGPSASNARLLGSGGETKVRFVPNTDYIGSSSFVFVAWDQTTGVNGGTAAATNRGGTKAFSLNARVATISVNNTAPVLVAGKPVLPGVFSNLSPSANGGLSIPDLLGSVIGTRGSLTDPDAGAQQGIAVTGADATNGSWEFTTDGGATWTNFGAVSAGSARLLAASSDTKLRFVPNPGYSGSVSVVFVAWDQTSGANGGVAVATNRGGTKAFSLGYSTATVSVQFVNHAPVLDDSGAPELAGIGEDVSDAANVGTSVASLIAALGPAGSLSDADYATVLGIAVTGADESHGTWQYSTDGGATWLSLGGVSPGSARLLSSADGTKVRFVPNGNYHGSSSLTFAGWDQTSGVAGGTGVVTGFQGGANSYSVGSETATIAVHSLNDAPELDVVTIPALDDLFSNLSPSTIGGLSVPGLLSRLISGGGSLSDADEGAVQGIAVTGVDQAHGTWQYSLNGGTTWTDFGSPTSNAARLLSSSSSNLIRFLPAVNYSGSSSFTFVAWDETAGTDGEVGVVDGHQGGVNTYSIGTGTGLVGVQFVNHAPVLNPAGDPRFPDIDEDIDSGSNTGLLVSELISRMGPAGGISDVDHGAVQGIAITGTSATQATWQYSLDGGVHWTSVGSVSNSAALLLAADSQTRVRISPVSSYHSNRSGSITFRAWDQETGTNGGTASTALNGDGTAFSTATEVASISINRA